MKRNNFFCWARILLLIFSTATICLAQSDTARLQGTVTDPQGAAIDGATVTVTNAGTGWQSTVTTNELGYYAVSALLPGYYRVEISQTGFKKVSRELELQVAQLGVANFQLDVGAITETVVVEAGSPVLDSQDSAIGTVVEGKQIAEMPLNGRNFTELATLVPGVIRGSGNATGSNNQAETFRYGQEYATYHKDYVLRSQERKLLIDCIYKY